MAGPTGTPPPLLPGVLQLAVATEDPPCQAVNVLHFLCHETGGLGASDVSNMVSALGGYFVNDLWKVRASSSTHVVSFTAVYAKIEGAPNVTRVRLADATAGSIVHDIAFANAAFLINWATGDPRKGGKPRTYLMGVPSNADADSANITSTDITALSAGCATFIGHVEGHVSGQLVCDHLVEYSKVNHGAYRATGVTYTITSGVANPVIGTQRRRVGRIRA